ncbi:MAG: copper chaperone PCu(A)C [Rhodospirillaceae bacterium]
MKGHEHGGPLDITGAWARATPGPVPNGAAYLTINNHRDATDRLLSAATPRAKRAEIHEHVMEGDIARMRRVDGLALGGHTHTAFKPGGYHVMLMGLNSPLKEGESFPLTLTFKNRGAVTVEVKVLGVGAKAPGGGMGHDGNHGDHKDHGDHSGHQMGDHINAAAKPGDTATVAVHRISADGVHEALGQIVIAATAAGVQLRPDVRGLTPGRHAFHVHANPDCGVGTKVGKKVAGLAAGGHYVDHGAHGAHAGHGSLPAGNLPDLIIGADGRAVQPVDHKRLNLSEIKNRALMIHAYPTEKDAGGPRVACGIIKG